MRAFQYYELAELFGVPLILSTTQETNTPRCCRQVGADNTDLNSKLSARTGDKKYHEIESDTPQMGSQALMARCFLFYTTATTRKRLCPRPTVAA